MPNNTNNKEKAMQYGTFAAHLNALVSKYLENSGDPAEAADLLREIADEVFEEEPEADGYGNGGLTWAQAKAQGK